MPTAEPPRLVVNAVEGWGKTTIGAYAPKPAILMARGETGYATLANAGRVPVVPSAKVDSWGALLGMIDGLAADPQGIETLVLDALVGFEALCHEHVCNRDFGGEWAEKGFLSFHKGYELGSKEWLILLARLDRLRETHGVMVILLSHARVKPFKNPLGEDFDRYEADAHHKTWGATAKWADASLFGTFLTVVDKKPGEKTKGKGIGGTDRVVYTERRDGYDAKNRYGMRESFLLSDNPAESWGIIANEMKGQANASTNA